MSSQVDLYEQQFDKDMSRLLTSRDYPAWRETVEATGGCMSPIRLRGQYQITHPIKGVLHDRSGGILVPCGTRRAGVCPSCANRYAQDAFHLIRAGLSGDDAKGIPADVAKAPRLFVTLTAPSFGKVHSRRLSARGRPTPCGCGEYHHPDDPRVHGAINPDEYDYEAAVLWQAHSGHMWQRWCMAVRRHLAAAGSIKTRELRKHLTLSYSKVAEFQKRGMIHFHSVVRIDGPDGAGSPAPSWVTSGLLAQVVRAATASVTIRTYRPTGEALNLKFGTQCEPEEITNDGKSAAHIAGYIAKYATKDSGATQSGVDRRILSRSHIAELKVSEHHRRMILTAWNMGGLGMYEHLGLRRWAHMLAFRGHFLSKSKVYSSTFKALKAARQLHRLNELIATLDVSADEITVINDWQMVNVGHHNDAERELAAAISERQLESRKDKQDVPN